MGGGRKPPGPPQSHSPYCCQLRRLSSAVHNTGTPALPAARETPPAPRLPPSSPVRHWQKERSPKAEHEEDLPSQKGEEEGLVVYPILMRRAAATSLHPVHLPVFFTSLLVHFHPLRFSFRVLGSPCSSLSPLYVPRLVDRRQVLLLDTGRFRNLRCLLLGRRLPRLSSDAHTRSHPLALIRFSAFIDGA
mmetsp:Transcript_51196/g.159932  ORF Transcript_51196/g.159932 Transcript_51196/m.159932 type:complete len:190 (-) Transcript_51196:2715-3284(-)